MTKPNAVDSDWS